MKSINAYMYILTEASLMFFNGTLEEDEVDEGAEREDKEPHITTVALPPILPARTTTVALPPLPPVPSTSKDIVEKELVKGLIIVGEEILLVE